ncbi:thioredoxin-domain-containing protein [Linderina pennispora]|uniref:Thioredoxin-domain-containing protein n=1 Tax=Linderina pennispora TaxID=61395 RepID=A0A1Y1WL38_9FUNG|nr:thioredoxin-domain-containing protein [Linderina pennispora]ORX74267.1 thioredoxin-domain-containing protein [Linderina pennispora]
MRLGKFLLGLAGLALTTAVAASGAPVSDKSHVLTATNFESKTQTGTWIIKHYSPQCHHCLNFAPKWERVVRDTHQAMFANNVHYGEVNCLEEQDLCAKNGADAWPMVVVFKESKRAQAMSGDKTEEELMEFVQRSANVHEAVRRFEQNSVVLTPANFTETVNDAVWLIKHYSPKCPHCRHMAPAWTKMTDEMAEAEGKQHVFFGEINCLDYVDLCVNNKVDGFPTIHVFYKGSLIEEMGLDPTYENMQPFAKRLAQRRDSGEFDKALEEPQVNNDNRDWDDDEADPKKKDEPPKTPKKDEPKKDEPKKDEPKKDEPKKDEPKKDEPKKDEPKKDEPKKDDKALPNAQHDENADTEKRNAVVYNPDGEAVVLTKENFAERTASGPWFIKFYAPWCPHCQHLAPVWAELGGKLRGKMNVGSVNCDEASSLCSKYNVQGYPTLKLLWDGETADYKGERELKALEKFVDSVLAQPHTAQSVQDVQAGAAGPRRRLCLCLRRQRLQRQDCRCIGPRQGQRAKAIPVQEPSARQQCTDGRRGFARTPSCRHWRRSRMHRRSSTQVRWPTTTSCTNGSTPSASHCCRSWSARTRTTCSTTRTTLCWLCWTRTAAATTWTTTAVPCARPPSSTRRHSRTPGAVIRDRCGSRGSMATSGRRMSTASSACVALTGPPLSLPSPARTGTLTWTPMALKLSLPRWASFWLCAQPSRANCARRAQTPCWCAVSMPWAQPSKPHGCFSSARFCAPCFLWPLPLVSSTTWFRRAGSSRGGSYGVVKSD